MFDTLDAAMCSNADGHFYFFKRKKYIHFKSGAGVIAEGDISAGWNGLPVQFCDGLDAALYYPPKQAVYLFKGDSYVKWKPGVGVVPAANGLAVRKVGQDGWATFPPLFQSGVDAALYSTELGHAYFFKGGQYIKYGEGVGVVPLGGGTQIRTLGVDGWTALPMEFKIGIDAAFERSDGRLYFFRGRDYLRWTPGDGIDDRYPRRLGLIHGLNMLDGEQGGWPGLSRVWAGPLVGHVTSNSASLWIWLTESHPRKLLRVNLNGTVVGFQPIDPVHGLLAADIQAIRPGSAIRILRLTELAPTTDYTAQLWLDNSKLDEVRFRTAPAPSNTGTVRFLVGSCADMSKHSDVSAFQRMGERQNANPGSRSDFVVLCGDNCYYVNGSRTTDKKGDSPRDWQSAQRMLQRQIQARNHPQFCALSRSVPIYATWDDHDFGYNNSFGSDAADWVGRDVAARVFRAFWPNQYTKAEGAIYHSMRWGPVEVFYTDSRFNKDHAPPLRIRSLGTIWGNSQLDWLISALQHSSAPVKVVVVSNQFLYNEKPTEEQHQEGHVNEAAAEREALLDALDPAANPRVTGRVLFVSGDVHFSELLRFPASSPTPHLLELTNSPLRRGVSDDPPAQKIAGSRIWAIRQNGFGIVTVEVKNVPANGAPNGSITFEARNDSGILCEASDGTRARTVWDLSTGGTA